MSDTKRASSRALTQGDLECIERLIYKGNDDVAVAIARSFERLEERIDGAESRLYSRIADVEDKILAGQDAIGELKSEVRELARLQEDAELEDNHPSNHD